MSTWFERLAARPQRTILFLGVLLLFAGNAILPMTDRDEARFSEASREMIQRGDYIVPWFNGEWRFDKPVLIYWCQIASYKFFGENEFAARFPSAVFCIATALLLARWAKSRSDNRTALLAGTMFLTALHVGIVIGRVATADMAMIFFCTLATWSGWELTRPENRERSKWWWIFYVALAFGFLAKGPVAWLPLGGMILGRILRKDGFRLPLNETVAGLCVTVALVALWGAPALAQTNGQFWTVGMGEHVLNRSVSAINGHGASNTWMFFALLPLYFITFFASFFPWSLRVPRTLKNWWPERKRDDLGWFLLVNALIVFVVFTLVKTKLPHYTMPAFPLISFWLARQISGDKKISLWFTRRLALMIGIILVVTVGGFAFARSRLLTENVWNAVQSHVTPETKVGCFGYTEPSLVWKFRSVTTNYVTLGATRSAKDFLTNTPPFILIVPTESLTNLPDTTGIIARVHGLDLVPFKNRDLTVIAREVSRN
ncbi:MAG TPA: glycosyltransferase family 39 protein [Candidatus Sulfotelmatobacter sp.]|jgi:4-amino-4-deoxy-L-arabinose transferase-like glycosyltransferase|nr:glycosyltransferase family 39 protein [Candidatus Sulfotelmatobacter sp.]